jgi:hypothetical protein
MRKIRKINEKPKDPGFAPLSGQPFLTHETRLEE